MLQSARSLTAALVTAAWLLGPVGSAAGASVDDAGLEATKKDTPIVLDALILRPFPYDLEGRLVYVGTAVEGRGNASSPTSVPDFLDLRERARTVDLAAYRNLGVNLAGDPAEWIGARRITADFLPMLGVAPDQGRGFLPEEDAPGAAEVAILAHELWERRFGADPGVLGSAIEIDGVSATVVGILPAGFELERRARDAG